MTWVVVWCTDGLGYKHPFPGTFAVIDGNVLHIRNEETFQVEASYSLFNIIRWGLTNE